MSPGAVFGLFYEQATTWINAVAQTIDALPIPFAFAAGMLATVNPCGFVMLPAFAAFYASAGGAGAGVGQSGLIWRSLKMGLLVTLAFIAVFGAIGIIVTAGGRVIMQWSSWAGLVVGVLLAGLGLYQLVTRSAVFGGLSSGIRIQRSATPRGVLLFGVGYAVCSLGCTLPVFMVVAGTVFLGDRDFARTALRFVQFALGMGFVLTVIAVTVAIAHEQATHRVRRLMPVADASANVLLVLAGLYVIWYWATKGVQL